jgi:hypothetical protein
METSVVAIITAVGGLLMGAAALVGTIINRRKLNAEANAEDAGASESIQRAALALVSPLEKRIKDLESRQARTDRQLQSALDRINYLLTGINHLSNQITRSGACPEWKPDPWNLPE